MDTSQKRFAEISLDEFPIKRFCTDEVFQIEELPTEIQFKIFDYLDLKNWKNARRACHQWNKLLCEYPISHKFPLNIRNCVISANRPPMSIFRNTFSSHQVLQFFENILWDDEKSLIDFIGLVGQRTHTVRIFWMNEDLLRLSAPNDFLLKFTNLRVIECDLKLLMKHTIPHTVVQFDLYVKSFMRREEIEKVESLLSNQSKKVVVRFVELVESPEENDVEFLKLDQTIRDIAIETKVTGIDVENVNIRETRTLKLTNIKEFIKIKENYYNRWKIDSTNNKNFLIHLDKMPKLCKIRAKTTPNDNCFFTHNAKVHKGVVVLELIGQKLCVHCLTSILQSSPNVKELILAYAEIDPNLIFKICSKLEVMHLFYCVNFLEQLVQSPNETLMKMSNLKHLWLIGIQDENMDFKSLIEKLPKMPALTNLVLSCDSGDISKFRGMFRLCPNIEEFSFYELKSFDFFRLVEILKLYSNLRVLQLKFKQMETYDSKVFIDVIAPFAKNLQILDVSTVAESELNVRIPETDCYEYAIQKIPTLRGFENDDY